MKSNEQKTEQPRLRVKFETQTALYAAQVLVNTNPGELILNFSSGVMSDQAGGENVLPIHTRIAMTRETAVKLLKLLDQSLAPKPVKK
jgi:uncharacterized protein (DUF1778 family)